MAAGSAAVLSNFIINLCVWAGCFGTFTLIRVKPWCKRFFASRRYAKDIDLKPKRLPNTLVAWIWPVMTYEEERIIDEIGLDGAMYLRVLRFGFVMFLAISAFVCITILPTNLTSNYIQTLLYQQTYSVGDLTLEDMGNGTLLVDNTYLVPGTFVNATSNSSGYYNFTLPISPAEMVFNTTLVTDFRNDTPVRVRPTNSTLSYFSVQIDEAGAVWRCPVPYGVNSTDFDRSAYPENATECVESSPSKQQEYKFTDFDKYSLANVENGSAKMWVHMIATYIVCAFVLWMLWKYNKESVYLRLLFLGNSKRGGPTHTVLVTDIPGIYGAVAKGLKAERQRQKSSSSLKSQASGGVNMKDNSLYGNGAPSVSAQVDDGVVIGTPVANGRGGANGHLAQPPPPPPPLPPPPPPEPVNGKHVTIAADAQPPPPNPFARAAGEAGEAIHDAAKEVVQKTKDFKELMVDGTMPTAPSMTPGSYRLTADVDPRYAATGGKLEQARIGRTREELLAELQIIEPEPETLPAGYCVDNRPRKPDRRTTKRYAYDVTSEALLAITEAKRKLKGDAVRGIPPLTPQQLVAQEFSLVYGPANIAAVNMIADTRTLEPLVNEYNKLMQAFEDWLEMAKLRLKLRKSLAMPTTTLLCMLYGDWEYTKKFNTKWFKKVDSLEFWQARLEWLKGRIAEEQVLCAMKVAPSAFVTFNTRMASAVAYSSLHWHGENDWRVTSAPAPFEVVWGNLRMLMPVKSARTLFIWIVYWLMALFFMIPVSAVQLLIESPKLAAGPLTEAPLKQLFEAIVPSLAMKIFLAIVPMILRFFAYFQGCTSLSEIDFSVVGRYFLFQVIVLFFGNVVAGSFFNQIKQWVEDPASVITVLGQSIPMQSTFFITYLLTNGLGAKSLAFIRAPAFAIFWVLSKFAGSPRARQRMWMYQYTDNGTNVPEHTLAILLGLVFSCINPIAAVAAFAYFFVQYTGESYNNLYVYRRAYESGGRLWKTVYNQIMTCMYIMQITMIGLLAIKKFKFIPILIPLPIISVGCHIGTLGLFNRPWTVTALHDAAEMDMLEADQRREQLLAAAREERKKQYMKRKREYDAACRKAEAEGNPSPPPSDFDLDKPLHGGRAEKLLLESLSGDGFAMNSKEKEEIAEMYKNPVFKVHLEDVQRLVVLKDEVAARLPRLNDWVTKYKRYQRAVAWAKKRGRTDVEPPPPMPQDLTIFDEDPGLVDSDHEDGQTERSDASEGGDDMPGLAKV
ncbi:hypothetical protein HYH03_018987 [Edaphochlamys debaryana]|uniref:Uncharacterized protein n=1 Tax=Edaphochlamys debaryana TaxID=47281 RepID=A0A835XGS1_9CHLO|nr:hypothetical protein HYH03_018987 [Edaphochlamys debaryana]|eukprot:KAG2482061.1 hypothetical protein HYH03_018987 [Edaphochlamys debaryana]